MDRWSTKDPYEREEDEAARLVRPAPKVKPPRHDKRREHLHVDPDADTDTDDEPEEDLSLNYKTIGGSTVSRRIVQRFAEETVVVVNKDLDDEDNVVWVRPETLHKEPGKYQKRPPNEPEPEEGKPRQPAQARRPDRPQRHKDPLPHPKWPDQRPLPKRPLKPPRAPHPVRHIPPFPLPKPEHPVVKPPGWVPETRTPSGRYASVSRRVLARYLDAKAPQSRYIRVKRKDTGETTRVLEETLKEHPESFSKIEEEEEEASYSEQRQQLEEMAKDNPKLRDILKDLSSKGLARQQAETMPDATVQQFYPDIRKWPKGIETIGDLVGIVEAKPKSTPKPSLRRPSLPLPKEEPPKAEAPAKTLPSAEAPKAPAKAEPPPAKKKPKEAPPKAKKSPGDTLESEQAKPAEKPEPKAEGEPAKELLKKPLKKDPAFYGEAHRLLREQAKDDPGLDAILQASKPGTQWDEFSKMNPDHLLTALFKGQKFPEGLETVSDLVQAARTKPAKAPKAPKAPAAEPGKAVEPPAAPAGAPEPKAEGKPAEEPAKPAEEAPKAKGKKPKPPAEEEAPGPKLRGWKEATAEQKEAAMGRLLNSALPHDFQLSLIKARMHPDDMQQVIAGYEESMKGRVPSDLNDFADKASRHYTTDPTKVQPPKEGKGKDGNAKPFEELSAEEQSEAMSDWRNKTLALSMAARAQLSKSLAKKTGAPEGLAENLAEFMLNQPEDEPSWERWKRVQKLSDAYFESVLQQAEAEETKEYEKRKDKDEPEDEEERKRKRTKPLFDQAAISKVLKEVGKDPAAQQLAVSFFQAHDYQAARKKFLDPKAPDLISEFQSPREFIRGLRKADDFFAEQEKKYPTSYGKEGVGSPLALQNLGSKFRTRLVNRIRTLAPKIYDEIGAWVDEKEIEDFKRNESKYEREAKHYEKAQTKYDKTVEKVTQRYKKEMDEYAQRLQKAQSGGSYRGAPKTPEPPKPFGARLKEMGVEQPIKPTQPKPPPHYVDKAEMGHFRKQFLSPDEGEGKTASVRVVRRFAFSSCAVGLTMDQIRERKAVYWGVPVDRKGITPYPEWGQVHQRDMGTRDYDALLRVARDWLKTPVLAVSVEGIERDSQLRAALDLAIRTHEDGKYSVGVHPSVYNLLLAKLAGKGTEETLTTVREARTQDKSVYAPARGESAVPQRSTNRRPDMSMPKFASQDADRILGRLDRIAHTIQTNHQGWGMPFEQAKQLVNALDKTADEIEMASFGKESFERRQAEVIQRDADEKYMDAFKNPMAPIQTEADEPYMKAYADDQSSAVNHGESTTGRPLAP